MIRAFLTFLASLVCLILLVPTVFLTGINGAFFEKEIWEGELSEDLYEIGVDYLTDETYNSNTAISSYLDKDRVEVLVRRNFDVDVVGELGVNFLQAIDQGRDEIVIDLEPFHNGFSGLVEDLSFEYYDNLPQCRVSSGGNLGDGLPVCLDGEIESEVRDEVAAVIQKKVEKEIPANVTLSSEESEVFRVLKADVRAQVLNLLMAITAFLFLMAVLSRAPRVWEMLFAGGTVLILGGAVSFFFQRVVLANLSEDFGAMNGDQWDPVLNLLLQHGLSQVATISGYLALVGTVLMLVAVVIKTRK